MFRKSARIALLMLALFVASLTVAYAGGGDGPPPTRFTSRAINRYCPNGVIAYLKGNAPYPITGKVQFFVQAGSQSALVHTVNSVPLTTNSTSVMSTAPGYYTHIELSFAAWYVTDASITAAYCR